MTTRVLPSALMRQARLVAATLIAALWRTRSADEVDAALEAMPAPQRAMAVGAVLAGLFGASLFAAQWGLLGIALFFVAVIVLVA